MSNEEAKKSGAHQPWDRREDEPPKAYTLFLAFRALGVTRTIRKCAEQAVVDERKLGKLAAHFAWTFRADQWDAWAMRHRSKAAEQRMLREIKVESMTISNLTRMAAILSKRALRGVMKDKNKELTPQGAAVLADIVVKLSRLQRGEVTSRRETIARDARARIGEKLERMSKALAEKFAPETSKGVVAHDEQKHEASPSGDAGEQVH